MIERRTRRTLVALLVFTCLLATGCPCRCAGRGDSAGTSIVGADRPS